MKRSIGKHNISAQPTPASLVPTALRIAAGQMETFCTRGDLDEEVLTNAMFGIFFDTMSWVVSLSGAAASDTLSCKWGTYRKYRSREVKETERYSGADFAFLVSDGEEHARLALFQAKRAFHEDAKDLTSPLVIDVHQRPKGFDALKLRETQMLRIARIGVRISRTALGPKIELPNAKSDAPAIDDLHWIHYLAYQSTSIDCIPLSKLKKEYKVEIGATCKPSLVRLNDTDRELSVRFSDILRGVSTESHPAWLRLKIDDALKELPRLADLMPVVVADERGAIAPKVEAMLGGQLIHHAEDTSFGIFRKEVEALLMLRAPRQNLGNQFSPSG